MTQHAGKSFELDESPTVEEVEGVHEALARYNARFLKDDGEGFAVVLRGQDGAVIAGIDGLTRWGRVFVEVLWVDEAYRGRGLGTRLLEQAERIGVARGCKAVDLDSMSFQAAGFYEKRGYRRFGELDGYPGGHRCEFFTKPI